MPGYEVPGFAYTLLSDGDIDQFVAVKVTDAGKAQAAGENENPIAGIAQMPAADALSEPIRIMQSGISFAMAGDAVRKGYTVAVSDDSGKLIEGAANIVGIALTDAGADEELFSVLLTPEADKA